MKILLFSLFFLCASTCSRACATIAYRSRAPQTVRPRNEHTIQRTGERKPCAEDPARWQRFPFNATVNTWRCLGNNTDSSAHPNHIVGIQGTSASDVERSQARVLCWARRHVARAEIASHKRRAHTINGCYTSSSADPRGGGEG